MTERHRSSAATTTTTNHGDAPYKMDNDLGPRKTVLVLVIVVGCFAVLWPKVFYPMLVGQANQHIKPSSIDKTSGCCDVISESDVNTIKLLSELCTSIKLSARNDEPPPRNNRELVQRCRQEVLDTCGIDIAAVLQEQIKLGQNVRQMLNEIRSLNGSLCLKYNFGVAPWKLGVPHRISNVKVDERDNIRQERPLHLRSELIHPAFRERGRAIPQSVPAAAVPVAAVPPVRPPPKIVDGRPGPIPGMRPTIGGAGHVVPPPKQGTSSMSIIMPIYTIGIVVFFTYTLMKIIFKKQPESVGALYPPVEPDPNFRKQVFEAERSRVAPKMTRESISTKLGWMERDAIVNAMSALLDEVDQEIEARRKSTSNDAAQDLANGSLSNGSAPKPQEDDQPTVKVLGMEMTASCEGGKKWSRPESPILSSPSPVPPVEQAPQEIYLEGALPAQSHLLVAESATQKTEEGEEEGEDPAVVLSGKMTLSLVSLDSSESNDEKDVQEEEEVVEEVEKEEYKPKIQFDVEKEVEEEPKPKVQFDVEAEVEEEPKPKVQFDVEEKVEEEELKPKVQFDVEKEVEEEQPKPKVQFDVKKEVEEEEPKPKVQFDVEEEVEEEEWKPQVQFVVESPEHQQFLEISQLEKEVDELIQQAFQFAKEQNVPVQEISEQKTVEDEHIFEPTQLEEQVEIEEVEEEEEEEETDEEIVALSQNNKKEADNNVQEDEDEEEVEDEEIEIEVTDNEDEEVEVEEVEEEDEEEEEEKEVVQNGNVAVNKAINGRVQISDEDDVADDEEEVSEEEIEVEVTDDEEEDD